MMSAPAESFPTAAAASSPAGERVPLQLSIAQAGHLLKHPARWRVLRELAKREMMPLGVLAELQGCEPFAMSMHLKMLARLGLTMKPYRGLHMLTLRCWAALKDVLLDLGPCLVKLDAEV